jgi:hypothetical protein
VNADIGDRAAGSHDRLADVERRASSYCLDRHVHTSIGGKLHQHLDGLEAQCEYIPFLQLSHRPHALMQEIRTRSPA